MRQSTMNMLNWVFRLKYVFALVVFAGVIGFVGESSLVNRIAQQQEISKLKEEISDYDRRFKADNVMLNSLKNDQDAIREVARERYYMKTENEDIFIIEDDGDE